MNFYPNLYWKSGVILGDFFSNLNFGQLLFLFVNFNLIVFEKKCNKKIPENGKILEKSDDVGTMNMFSI